jgi:hypothetical protein
VNGSFLVPAFQGQVWWDERETGKIFGMFETFRFFLKKADFNE